MGNQSVWSAEKAARIVEHFDVEDLVMSATSYYLGRMTALVGTHCERLVKAWPTLSMNCQDYIRRIVENAFQQDEAIKDCSELQYRPLGQECDRVCWRRVRALWKGGE
jgi:hypothetical protein